MKIHLLPSLLAVAIAAAIAAPISNAADEKKRNPRPAPVVSPTIHDDGRVTFRVQAPDAEKVSVSGEMYKGKAEMTKDDKGIWSVTLDAVEPGLYGYSLSIDGVKMLDPGNSQLKPGRSPRTSILHIPGDQIFDFKDVAHGTVHHHSYHSKPIDRFRELNVYTPPGYETGGADYPLLVLQHGHSDSFDSWAGYGKAHWILDNLIAEGKAEPMIVVMLDGHPIASSYGNGRDAANTEELRRDILEAALPMMEKLYRVKAGRDNRAIVGLSMGGLHSLTIGLNELDTFAWVGAFSAAAPETAAVSVALGNSEETNKALDLLWIACGKDDFLLKENQKFIAALEEAGIAHQWHLTEGSHAWPIWRGYLADFAPLLFKK
jgi:enterochelin esterase family protein